MTAATGFVGTHSVHLALLAGPALLFGVLAAGSDLRAWARRHDVRGAGATRVAAAVLSAGAAAIHVIVCPEHVHEALIYGAFFAVAATTQLGWAAWTLMSRARWLGVAGALGNMAMVALWLVTRTVGVPLGPGAGETESFGALDIAASACEVGVVVCCLALLFGARRRRESAVRETRARSAHREVAAGSRPSPVAHLR